MTDEIKMSDDIGGGNLNFRDSNGTYYINGDIDDTIPKEIIAPLVKDIEIAKNLIEKKPIRFFITSSGGSAYTAFDLIAQFEYAKKLGVPIHTIVTSFAASAASIIAVSGHVRFASRRACYLLHYARCFQYSHNPIMTERNTVNLNFVQKELEEIYKKRTKIKGVASKMLADNYMINGIDELIKNGVVDYEF